MFDAKVRIPKELIDRVKEAAAAGGYSSVDEFVIAALEREIERIFLSIKTVGDSAEVKKKLQGLGYID